MDKTCMAHDELFASMSAMTVAVTKLAGDLRWLILLGKWGVGFLGATVVLIVPLAFAIGSYLISMDNRITALEAVQHRVTGVATR